MLDISKLISISESAGASVQIQEPAIECPEEYKNLSMSESSLYFENQMLRCELEYRDIMDESVNTMIQDILDQQNGIVNEAAEETKKSGFREWCTKVRNWFINIFKSIGNFFRGLIDKLTKNSKRQKDLNDTLDKNIKTSMDRLKDLGEEAAKEVEEMLKKNQCKCDLNIIDGVVFHDGEEIVAFRNAALKSDKFIDGIDVDEIVGKESRVSRVYYDMTDNKYTNDIPSWNDSLDENKDLQKALFKIFKFKKEPDTFTELVTMLENKKIVEVSIGTFSASFYKNMTYFDDMCFKYISKESVGTELKLCGPMTFNYMVKNATDFLTEWEKYSKSVLNDMNRVLKDLETEKYTHDTYTRFQRYVNALISVSSKRYSLITKIFNLMISIGLMYVNDSIALKTAIFKHLNIAMNDVKTDASNKESEDEKKIKQNKEKIKSATNTIKNSYKEMKKTAEEIDKIDPDDIDKHNPGLRQELLDLLKDD